MDTSACWAITIWRMDERWQQLQGNAMKALDKPLPYTNDPSRRGPCGAGRLTQAWRSKAVAALASCLLLLAVPLHARASVDSSSLPPDRLERQALALDYVVRFTERFQYAPVVFDGALAAKVINAYLEHLDPNHLYFSSADVAGFLQEAPGLPDMARAHDLSIPLAIARRHAEQAAKRYGDAIVRVNRGLDLNQSGSLRIDAGAYPGFSSDAELDKRWQAIVKSDWLNLKLEGLSDAQIRKALVARYLAHSTRIAEADAAQGLTWFIETYARSSGDGNTYVPSMHGLGNFIASAASLGLELDDGPGGPVVLSSRPGYSPSGAPALQRGDRIVAIGRPDKMTYVEGADAGQLVAILAAFGEADVVYLDVLPAGGLPGAPLVHTSRVVKRAAASGAASMRVTTVAGGSDARVAVISIPTFYAGSSSPGKIPVASVSDDVAQMIDTISRAGPVGIVLDLRGCGGGSLEEAAK